MYHNGTSQGVTDATLMLHQHQMYIAAGAMYYHPTVIEPLAH